MDLSSANSTPNTSPAPIITELPKDDSSQPPKDEDSPATPVASSSSEELVPSTSLTGPLLTITDPDSTMTVQFSAQPLQEDQCRAEVFTRGKRLQLLHRTILKTRSKLPKPWIAVWTKRKRNPISSKILYRYVAAPITQFETMLRLCRTWYFTEGRMVHRFQRQRTNQGVQRDHPLRAARHAGPTPLNAAFRQQVH